MKKFVKIQLSIILSLVTVLAACSKSDDGTPPIPKKDYTEAIKGKIWVGALTYAGKPKEYYSVQFKTDNSLIWSEYSGDYAGKWAVDGQRLKLTFTVSGKEFSASISDDNKLTDITNYPTNGWEIKTGELNPNANMVLDNTVWRNDLPATPGVFTLALYFKPGSAMDYFAVILPTHVNYSRIGAGLRFTPYAGKGAWFGVISADGKEINGSDWWVVLKK